MTRRNWIPITAVAVAAVLGLGLLAGVGFGWGLFSLLGWLALDDPNAGRSAVVFLGGGAPLLPRRITPPRLRLVSATAHGEDFATLRYELTGPA